MLYIIATPIGNLQDITLRAIDIMKSCDYILCEDTRHSMPLLLHYGIQKPLKSLHQFNETAKAAQIIDDLQSGKNIALISDAGTPGISDPGQKLVSLCVEQDIAITPIPGPCAAIAALSASGLSTDRFEFRGFLPRAAGDLRKTLQGILRYPGTTVCYESPKRLEQTLKAIQQLDDQRQIVVARELTKKFETFAKGTASQLLDYFSTNNPKGEIVLLIEGEEHDPSKEWSHLSPQEHVQMIETTYGVSKHDAIKLAAEMRGVSKRDIYNQCVKKSCED